MKKGRRAVSQSPEMNSANSSARSHPLEDDPSTQKDESRQENPSPALHGRTVKASSKKKATEHLSNVKPRRSGRLLNADRPAQNLGTKQVMTEITIPESDKEGESDSSDGIEHPHHIVRNKNLDRKIDYLLERLESHQTDIKDLKSLVNLVYLAQNPCPADARYRSLYIESQKNVDSLRDEINQLSLKLQNALGKVEGYEKCFEILGKLKDITAIPNPTKAPENPLNAFSPAVQSPQACETSSPGTNPAAPASLAKRKRRI